MLDARDALATREMLDFDRDDSDDSDDGPLATLARKKFTQPRGA